MEKLRIHRPIALMPKTLRCQAWLKENGRRLEWKGNYLFLNGWTDYKIIKIELEEVGMSDGIDFVGVVF